MSRLEENSLLPAQKNLARANRVGDAAAMKADMLRAVHKRLLPLVEQILDTADTETPEGVKVIMQMTKYYSTLVPSQTQNENMNIPAEEEMTDEQVMAELAHIRAQNTAMIAEREKAEQKRQLYAGDITDTTFEEITVKNEATATPRTAEEVAQRDE